MASPFCITYVTKLGKVHNTMRLVPTFLSVLILLLWDWSFSFRYISQQHYIVTALTLFSTFFPSFLKNPHLSSSSPTMQYSTIVLALAGNAAVAFATPSSPARASSSSNRSPSHVGKRSVGYFGNWVSTLLDIVLHSSKSSLQDVYGRNFTVDDIPAEKYSHIVYSFAKINDTTGKV
jgi:hypothetical protein